MIQVEGGISVKAAMLGNKRTVEKIFLDEARHDKDAHFIERKAEELSIPLEKLSRQAIDEMAAGRTHGGVLACVGERRYQTRQETLQGMSLLALVEGVEDPFNLGYIMRSLYSAGCTGLLLRNRDWSNAESNILKSSAGAFEYLNVVLSNDLASDVKWYKQQGIRAFSAMRKDAMPYWDMDYNVPCLIAIGGEMRGLSSGVLKEMDDNIYIPYANDFRAALNAAGACAAIFFEAFRQREAVTSKMQ